MDRRRFLSSITMGGTAAGLEAGCAKAPKETHAVTWQVKGFSCVTCATGLEVTLRGMKGVTRATATYPEGNVAIGFNGDLTNEKVLKDFIISCGFSVA